MKKTQQLFQYRLLETSYPTLPSCLWNQVPLNVFAPEQLSCKDNLDEHVGCPVGEVWDNSASNTDTWRQTLDCKLLCQFMEGSLAAGEVQGTEGSGVRFWVLFTGSS